MPVSERRVCRVLGQHRSTQRKTPRGADDEAALTENIIALARQYGRYGYRRVTALLRDAGWHVNRKRVERIWRREGLKVTEEIRHGMVAALVSHKRPVIELIRPTPKDQRDAFKAKFEGMTQLPFSYDDHVVTLERLAQTIRSELTEDDRTFLYSFEAGDPAWDLFPLDGLAELPAPQFKLLNIRRFREEQPGRHATSLMALESY